MFLYHYQTTPFVDRGTLHARLAAKPATSRSTPYCCTTMPQQEVNNPELATSHNLHRLTSNNSKHEKCPKTECKCRMQMRSSSHGWKSMEEITGTQYGSSMKCAKNERILRWTVLIAVMTAPDSAEEDALFAAAERSGNLQRHLIHSVLKQYDNMTQMRNRRNLCTSSCTK